MMKLTFWEQISVWWCQQFHTKAYWPMNGVYRCQSCLKSYAVPGTPIKEIPYGVYFRDEQLPKMVKKYA